MTATEVNVSGVMVAVVAQKPALSPLGANSKTGEPILYQQIRDLTLADGSHVHGCVHCAYTHETVGSVRSHLRKHAAPKPIAVNGKAVGGGCPRSARRRNGAAHRGPRSVEGACRGGGAFDAAATPGTRGD